MDASQIIQDHIEEELESTEILRNRYAVFQRRRQSWEENESDNNDIASPFSWNGKSMVDNCTQIFVKASQPKPEPMLPAFQKSRLLLSHLGFLNYGGIVILTQSRTQGQKFPHAG